MDIKTVFENTAPEQRQRAFRCKSAEELQQFVKSEGMELSAEDVAELYEAIHKNTGEISDDNLDNVAGGKSLFVCPQCGSEEIKRTSCTRLIDYYACNKCGETWAIDA